ncbi:MAG TPA: hypothetical protein ENI87_14740 [bacterium]|nr:hypothetical protein [bacterium]
MVRAVVLVLVFAVAAVAQRKGRHERWPFGNDGNAAASMLQKRDLFNLGPLGAKAWDADRPEPSAERASGRQRFENGGERGEDVGPKRLLVRALFGGGPAQKAGLRLDDVIVGVDGRDFQGGCFAPLADAILRAEAKTGKLVLQVERAGKALSLTVKLKKLGKAASNPEAGKQRDRLLKAACAWLADHQQGGGFPETLGGTNGAVVMTCLAGLAWVSVGSSLKKGKHKAELNSAVSFVLRNLGTSRSLGDTGANWDQTTWGYAHAAIFLGELQLAGGSKKVAGELQEIADILCKRQEASGGYGHGPGGRNALGYIELNILAAYVLCGLSLAEQNGCEVDAQVVDKLLGYCRESAGEDGGVGYATGPGQKGMGNIGRTAGTWLGARGLGRGGDPFPQRMKAYVQKHIAAITDGHASLQQHILLAGIAAAALGGEVEQAYWDGGLRRDLTLARAPDGSFHPRPWHESLLMNSNTDVSMGEVWTTASWAIVLGARGTGRRGGLPGLCGGR